MSNSTKTLALGVTIAAYVVMSSSPAAAQGTTVDASNVIQLCLLDEGSAESCSCQAKSINSEIGDTKFAQFNTVAGRMIALESSGQKETPAYEALESEAGQLTAVGDMDFGAFFLAMDECPL